jgi:diguanylate cyclase (GGDEF)-like protein
MPLARAIPIVATVLLLLFLMDYYTGYEISFSIFYLIPVTLAVLFHGRNLGLAVSVLSAVAWISAELLAGARFSNPVIPLWNSSMRLGYFAFHVLLISGLLQSIEKINRISVHDPLTDVANWRYFEEHANAAIKKAVRDRSKITLAYFDIDNFKSINDTFGHGTGDQILIEITRAVRSTLPAPESLARLGGDEFAILLPDADLDVARELLEKARVRVREEMASRKWDVTLSIGAMVFSVLPSTIGPMLKQVDDLMYEVKNSGKNNLKIVRQYE